MSPIDPRRLSTSCGASETILPGSTDVDFTLGPVLLRVTGLPVAWDPFIAEHYEGFATPVDPTRRPDLHVVCREEPEHVIVPLPPAGGGTVLELTQRDGGSFEIRSHWQHGTVTPAAGVAELKLTTRNYIGFRMSLENFLRISSQLLLIERGAFLVHGAGIVHDGRCFLFFGPSGAGKSTVTEFSEPRAALSDDLVLVDASGSEVRAHAVPFFGAYAPTRRARGTYPVAAGCRLRQSESDRLEPLTAARAVATFSASVPYIHEFGIRHDGLTACVARACALIPIYDMYFTRSGRFWEMLDRV